MSVAKEAPGEQTQPDLDEQTVVQIPAHVIFRKLDAEGVLLDLDQGIYFGLNESSRAMWEQLASNRPLGRVHESLLGQYEVTPQLLWDDLVSLVAELLRLGLVHIDG